MPVKSSTSVCLVTILSDILQLFPLLYLLFVSHCADILVCGCPAPMFGQGERFHRAGPHDKAVRPTNIMGATKRISEIYAQLHNIKNKITKFSIIRFGNVIGSNGSVIPLFNYQIKKGGPITLTHKEITRYFMLIPEAVGLVLQSTYLSIGGEVFVLKMGKPIKIIDIAKKMIKLHGYSLKDNENPKGDVEIKITGLRPGEKMHEELLIGDNPTNTAHPDIIMALENIPDENNFKNFLIKLKNACENNDKKEVVNLIKNNVEGMENYKNLK